MNEDNRCPIFSYYLKLRRLFPIHWKQKKSTRYAFLLAVMAFLDPFCDFQLHCLAMVILNLEMGWVRLSIIRWSKRIANLSKIKTFIVVATTKIKKGLELFTVKATYWSKHIKVERKYSILLPKLWSFIALIDTIYLWNGWHYLHIIK